MLSLPRVGPILPHTISPEGRRRVPKSRMQFIIEAAAGSAFTSGFWPLYENFARKYAIFLFR